MRKVIVPRIGDLAVSEATAERLQRTLDAIAAENGPGEAKKARAVLSGMMGLAARSDAVKANPVRELAPIQAKAVGATSVPLSELPVILERVASDERLQSSDLVDLIEFMAGTGLGISEAIDLDGTDVAIIAPAGVPTIGAVMTVRKSKTNAGERRITVPAAVATMLARRTLDTAPPVPHAARQAARPSQHLRGLAGGA